MFEVHSSSTAELGNDKTRLEELDSVKTRLQVKHSYKTW